MSMRGYSGRLTREGARTVGRNRRLDLADPAHPKVQANPASCGGVHNTFIVDTSVCINEAHGRHIIDSQIEAPERSDGGGLGAGNTCTTSGWRWHRYAVR